MPICVQNWEDKQICVLAWGCLPCAGVGVGGGHPSHHGDPGYYQWENLDILHKKSCIFVHISISQYSHFNVQKHETIRQNIGGDICHVVPNQIIGDMSPTPPVSAPMVISQKESNIASPNLVDMMMLRHPGMDQKSDWHGSDFWSKRREIKVASVFMCLPTASLHFVDIY